MNIILVGFKGCGKTTIGKELAKKMSKDFTDVDEIIEKKQGLSCREIYNKHGSEFFRKLEVEALEEVLKTDDKIIAVGGGTVMEEKNKSLIKKNSIVVYIKLKKDQLYNQIIKNGIPAFFNKKNPKKSFKTLLKKREPIYNKIADVSVDTSGLTAEKAAEKIFKNLKKLD